MENVTCKKSEVLEILRKNRHRHHLIFIEALEGYRKVAHEVLASRMQEIRTGKRVNLVFALPEPLDQTPDYDRAIKMLEMSTAKTVVLSESDFQCYVLDDWSWKRQFLARNSAYSQMATTMLAE